MTGPRRPRLVFVARRPPHPLDNGARIRGRRLLMGLAESFDTTLVTFDHRPGSPDGQLDPLELRRQLVGVEVLLAPGFGPGKRIGQLRSLVGRDSWSFARYARPELAALLTQAASRGRPCVVHFDDLAVAGHGRIEGSVNVYSAHNVEQEIVAQAARTGSPSRRLFSAVEARKVRHEEERVWRSMDLSLAVSELDAQAMRAAGARRVELCPNGTDPVEARPLQPLASGCPLRLVFVGSGGYAPYERGLAWLVRQVLPRVRDQTPVQLDVVGQRPAKPVLAPDVSYLGRVPSVGPHYEQAHVVVVPVFEGSGTRLKAIEAAAHGRPLVSTRLGTEGLPLLAGQHYLEANDPRAFAEALVTLANLYRRPGDPRLSSMLKAARAAVEPLFWPRIVKNLVGLYRAELEVLERR